MTCLDCIDFLFPFYAGIPYLLPAEEQRLRESLAQRHNQQVMQFSSPAFTSPMGDTSMVAKSPAVVPDEHKPFIENVWYGLKSLTLLILKSTFLVLA